MLLSSSGPACSAELPRSFDSSLASVRASGHVVVQTLTANPSTLERQPPVCPVSPSFDPCYSCHSLACLLFLAIPAMRAHVAISKMPIKPFRAYLVRALKRRKVACVLLARTGRLVCRCKCQIRGESVVRFPFPVRETSWNHDCLLPPVDSASHWKKYLQ